MKTTHYNNGVAIPNVANTASWYALTSGARCYYNNDSIAFDSVYGALYNYSAIADPGQLCPAGWHVPLESECKGDHEILQKKFIKE
ncbi:MAG: FISUMP domain-containing protein [Bacteroidota bacterium]